MQGGVVSRKLQNPRTEFHRQVGDHCVFSACPVTPVGACLGMDCSGGRMYSSSLRAGATSLGSKPLIDRTYAAICHAWYSGTRLRNDGMPLGRPCMMVKKNFLRLAAVDPIFVHQRGADPPPAMGVTS